MTQPLLWVQNNATLNDLPQKDSKKDAARIRSHAQCYRRKLDASSNAAGNLCSLGQTSQQKVNSIPNILAQSVQPNKALGRLASGKKPSASTRKRQKPRNSTKRVSNLGPATLSNSSLVLTQNIPWRWPDLCSSERRSLAFFELRTSQEWSGWEDTYFWNVLALQVSQQSEAVARSLIALSCLHEHMETMGQVERTQLQNLSSEQSAKAAEVLLARPETPHFEALVSCIIMTCLHGIRHSRASFLLLRSGLKLLEECKSERVSSEERNLVDKRLRPLFNRLLSSRCRVGDIGAGLKISIQRHRTQNLYKVAGNPLIATTFATLAEARQSLQQILNWGHDHVPLDLEQNPLQGHFLGTLHRLKYAWESALDQSSLPRNAHVNRSQKLLKAACIVGIIIIETLDRHEERIFDEYESDFERAISLVEQARPSQQTTGFGIDSGLIDIVAFLGTKCRHPKLRRRALQLLKDGGRIEGDRIASNPATIMEALIALEERDLTVVSSCQDIPESSRRHLVCGKQYIAERRIDLFYESADGLHKERCSVSLAAPGNEKTGVKFNAEAEIPDVIFGSGYAAYLEDWQSRSYFRLEMERFYFPIPKV